MNDEIACTLPMDTTVEAIAYREIENNNDNKIETRPLFSPQFRP